MHYVAWGHSVLGKCVGILNKFIADKENPSSRIAELVPINAVDLF